MKEKTLLSIIVLLLSSIIIIFFITIDYRSTVKDTEYKKTIEMKRQKAYEEAKKDLEDSEFRLELQRSYRDDNKYINFIIINGDTIYINNENN